MGDLQLYNYGDSLQQEYDQQQQQQQQQQDPLPTTDVDDVSVCKVKQKHRRVRVTTAAAGSLAGLYCMLICSVAVVLTLALALSGPDADFKKEIPLFLFHMYVYIAAFCFLVFLEFSVRRFKHKKCHKSKQTKPSLETKKPLSAQSSFTSEVYLISLDTENISHTGIRERGLTYGHSEADADSDVNLSYAELMKKVEAFPAFQFDGEGVNLFARMGLIAFGSCAVLLDGFRLLLMLDPKEAFPVTTILPIIARMLFTFLQIFSLFKNHTMLINYKHMLVKFGLLHVAAANICTWVFTLIIEAKQSIEEEHPVHGEEHPADNTTTAPTHQPPVRHISNHTSPFLFGHNTNALYDVASPYLFPFIIEFSLLAAAHFWKLYSNIGTTTVNPPDTDPPQQTAAPTPADGQCHKANTGLGLGMMVFVSAVVSMCLFLYLTTRHGMDYETTYIYLITDIIVNAVSLLATVPAFYQFHKLCFTGVLEEALDQNLLLTALGGLYILFGFIGFGSVLHVYTPGMDGAQAQLQLVSALVTFLQGTVQTVFIVDAQYRKAACPDQRQQKPGRSLVTFLLITNIAMWLINTIQLKEIDDAGIFSDTFGALAWKIILHSFLPLAAFYRFHASVCLSDIWEKTYSEKLTHTVPILSLVSSIKQH